MRARPQVWAWLNGFVAGVLVALTCCSCSNAPRRFDLVLNGASWHPDPRPQPTTTALETMAGDPPPAQWNETNLGLGVELHDEAGDFVSLGFLENSVDELGLYAGGGHLWGSGRFRAGFWGGLYHRGDELGPAAAPVLQVQLAEPLGLTLSYLIDATGEGSDAALLQLRFTL